MRTAEAAYLSRDLPAVPARPRRVPVITIVLLLVVAAAVWATVTAYQSMQDGVAAFRPAEAALASSAAMRTPARTFQVALDGTRTAQGDFHGAHLRLVLLAPIFEHLGWVPRYGPQLAAAPAAAALADDASSGALSLLTGIQPAVGLLGNRHPHAIATLLGTLAAQRSQFDAACSDFRAAQADEKLGTLQLSGSLARQVRSLNRQMPRLQVLCAGLALTPQLFGFGRPARYLIAYQNPSELRATGGFIGSAGIITARDGALTQNFWGTDTRDSLAVLPPEPVLQYNREPGWLFRDANWSPDFPTSAALERYFLHLNTGDRVDGVVNITPGLAAAILSATGPLYSPEYHRWITARNVGYLADYYAHLVELQPDYWHTGQRPSGPNTTGPEDNRRKQFMPIVARHLLQRLRTLGVPGWVRLGNSLHWAVERGDLLVNFNDPAEQKLAVKLGASGAISSTRTDFLYVVDTNIGYTKSNPYLHTWISYHAQIRPDRWIAARLQIHFRNVPAPLWMKGLGWWGPGGGRLGSWDDYGSFVRVFVPAGAALESQRGWWQWAPGSAYGKTMFSGYVLVPRGTDRTITLRYLIPPNVFVPSHGTRYSLLVPHQPGKTVDQIRVSVTADGRTHTWQVSQRYTTWKVSTAVAPRPFTPIPLPASPPEVVAPGHWIEPHAYLGAPRTS